MLRKCLERWRMERQRVTTSQLRDQCKKGRKRKISHWSHDSSRQKRKTGGRRSDRGNRKGMKGEEKDLEKKRERKKRSK